MNDQALPSTAEAPSTKLLVDAFYDCMRKCYWIKDDAGMWIPVEQGSIKLRLQAKGVSSKAAPGYMVSEMDRQLIAIQDQRSVQYVGPLAGYKAGLYNLGHAKVLVTTGYSLIEAKEGDWSMLEGIIDRLLNKDDTMPVEQAVYFHGWLHLAREAMVTGNHTLGQALVLCGPKCCGKSLLQYIITQCLGGRSARPYAFMMGKTTFNRELFGAEHLMIEDEAASLDMRTRRSFGAQIKQFAATRERACMGKHLETFNLAPFQRLSISLNEEPENVAILPPLDENMEDKLIILKAAKHPMPMPTFTPAEEAAFRAAIDSQIPAFLWWLENEFQVPSNLRAPRYGIQSFVHPIIGAIIDGLATHTRILYIIDRVLFSNDLQLPAWKGTADDLQHILLKSEYSYQSKQMLLYPGAMGTHLGHLAKSRCKRVRKEPRGDGNQAQVWSIFRDPVHELPSTLIVDRMLEVTMLPAFADEMPMAGPEEV